VVNTYNAQLPNGNAVRNILRGMLIVVIALAVAGMASAQDNNYQALVKFKGGIGVIPVTGVAANGTVNLNTVRGVNPGAPWRIADLDATVSFDGHIKVTGRGLLLASGNGIGTNAGQSVHATLFCGTDTTAHNTPTPGVALAADGDFKIDDFLSPPPPANCDTPVLLIRNVGGVWFAAGIPQTEDTNRK
jgi:hypothetical protein